MYAFVDGELSGSDRTAYEAHLVSCDACARATRLQSRFKAALRDICRGQKFRKGCASAFTVRLRPSLRRDVSGPGRPIRASSPWLSRRRSGRAVGGKPAAQPLIACT